ncbi:MAG: DUF1573 domain-containing protein [Saprospiraceae bacterium]|nr:DUF1573 domain-containing protein [Saprospiraceae bacterium]
MKLRLYLIITFLSCIIFHTQAQEIKIHQEQINIGSVKKGEQRTYKITIQNTGDKPLYIQSISCPDAVIMDKSKAPIPAGKSTTVAFRLKSNKTGKIHSDIQIRSNAKNKPKANVGIHGNVIGRQNIVAVPPPE